MDSYHVEEPIEFVELQQKEWNPVLEWLQKRLFSFCQVHIFRLLSVIAIQEKRLTLVCDRVFLAMCQIYLVQLPRLLHADGL